jgi:hypothetical protein
MTVPCNDWARVELWRWQYGELPTPDDMRPLNIPVALRLMATATAEGRTHPYNVAEVMRYVARLLEVKDATP